MRSHQPFAEAKPISRDRILRQPPPGDSRIRQSPTVDRSTEIRQSPGYKYVCIYHKYTYICVPQSLHPRPQNIQLSGHEGMIGGSAITHACPTTIFLLSLRPMHTPQHEVSSNAHTKTRRLLFLSLSLSHTHSLSLSHTHPLSLVLCRSLVRPG